MNGSRVDGQDSVTAPIALSIVAPCYNEQEGLSEFVARMIKAAEATVGEDYELILVNDGSRDNSRDVLDAYARRDPRVRVIHKENEGIPDTVNRGWRESRGKYVTWNSDDNLYHPSTIDAMVQYLETNPENALVYQDCQKLYIIQI